MANLRAFATAIFICVMSTPAFAIEGSAAAGPIGGTDIRVAHLPPPGLYAGVAVLGVDVYDFVDANGHTVPALQDAHLQRGRLGGLMLYVPQYKLFDGSFGFLGVLPGGMECGQLFATTPRRCVTGIGDPYVEGVWSRYFGTPRASRYPDSFPILEGLAIAVGMGVVIPLGKYDAFDAITQGLSIGNNIWDFAPTFAVTYVTPPILAEGTEISAKLFWNNYLTNPATQYHTGTLLNLDFAVTERIGRWHVGAAGFYAVQVADDTQFGIPVPPDGRRAETLFVGGIVAYDMPEYDTIVKFKALTAAFSANTVKSTGAVLTLAKKMW
jgi:hypothetical protein